MNLFFDIFCTVVGALSCLVAIITWITGYSTPELSLLWNIQGIGYLILAQHYTNNCQK